MDRHSRPARAGRPLEGLLVVAVAIGLALGVGVTVVSEVIVPAFAQINAALDIANQH